MSRLYCPECGNYLEGGDGECHDCSCGWRQPHECECEQNNEPDALTFEQIEEAFPTGASCDEYGNVIVTPQWLHDFARNIAAIAQQKGGE